MDRKFYVICDDDCRIEGMSKEQIFAAIAEVTGKTPTEIDAAFITKIKERNTGKEVSLWIGTEAEFNAITPAVETTAVIARVDSSGKLYYCTDEDVRAALGITKIQTDIETLSVSKMEKAAMSGYSNSSATTEDALNDWLDKTVLPSMGKDTCKHIVFRCGAICSWLLMGTIYKNTDAYAVIDVVEHLTGKHFTKVKKDKWQDAVPTDLIYPSGNIFSDTFTTKEKDASRFYVVEVQSAVNGNRDTFVVNVYTTGEGTLRYTRPYYYRINETWDGHAYYELAVTKLASGAVKFEMEDGNSHLFRITGYA